MNEKVIQAVKVLTRMMPQYRSAYRKQIGSDVADVEEAVRHAIATVPYYKDYGRYISDGFDLKKLPILRKPDILGRESEFLSRRVPAKLTLKKKTGGSTGHSLKLFYSLPTILKKDVVTDYATSLIGDHLKYAVIRGYVPADDKVAQVLRPDYMIVSSYKLTPEHLDYYIDAIKSHGSNCIMAYPSSITILARLIKKRYGTSPLTTLKGIMTSSEVFDADSRRLVQEVFPGVTLVDLYGHNELVVRAVSVDNGPYRFFQNYGYTEFIETGEVVNGHRVAEIVGTSIMNRAMPLLRYGTEDYVELDDEGRPVAILGRSCDFVVDKADDLVPCIVLTRDESMAHVINFQYYQPEPGRVIFRVVTRPEFNDHEKTLLTEDLCRSFPTMDCSVQQVKEIERTKIGKQKRLIQDFDLNDYR